VKTFLEAQTPIFRQQKLEKNNQSFEKSTYARLFFPSPKFPNYWGICSHIIVGKLSFPGLAHLM